MQSGCLTRSPSCFFPGWLCLTPSQTPTPSSTSLSSFSLSVVLSHVSDFLLFTLSCLALFLGPSADLHFLRLCLIFYSIQYIAYYPFPLLLLCSFSPPAALNGASPFVLLYCHFAFFSFLWSLQVSGVFFLLLFCICAQDLVICAFEIITCACHVAAAGGTKVTGCCGFSGISSRLSVFWC